MTGKRFTSMYNEQSDMIQYVDTLKEEPNKWSICNVSETLKKLNAFHEENNELRLQLNLCSDQRNEFHRGVRENANRVGKLEKENEQLKCGNKNLKATLNDFINICNRLQANPTDKQTLSVARDMLQNMGKELEE